MSIDRPTFHESWHRVAGVRARLRADVGVTRQVFRGRLWRVLQDPASNAFFRVNESAYAFLGLLDGERTVREVWELCGERLGEEAPTQGEVVDLLGQLYGSNLLRADAAGDVEALFRRQKKRVQREMKSTLMSLMFVRIPLVDPDRFFERCAGAFGWLFSWFGLVLWLGLLGVGGWFLVGRGGELVSGSSGVLAPGNLPLLYAALVLTKLLHEIGHGVACRTFGLRAGSGGEVHTLGVMLLVFVPAPYVDTSSSWALRSKWQRIVVGGAGMIVELAVAAVAAVVWARTAEGTALNALAYNTIFIAGVSTILFNANPLLRYDGYYMLSDLLELPNLQQRSRDVLLQLVKKRVWSVRRLVNPAHSRIEAWWLGAFGVVSFFYRTFVYVAILWFVAGEFFIVGALMAVVGVVTWLFVPIGKLVRYLATSPELAYTRGRAWATCIVVLVAAAAVIGAVPMPDRVRVEGVVEPAEFTVVRMEEGGFVEEAAGSGSAVGDGGAVLIRARRAELEADAEAQAARVRGLEARRRLAMVEDAAQGQILAREVSASREQLERVRTRLDGLERAVGHGGVWVSSSADALEGAYVERGETIGVVADLDRLIVRAAATQRQGPLIEAGADRGRVEMRAKGRPGQFGVGRVVSVAPAAVDELPSAALGYAIGGAVRTAEGDETGVRAAEGVFEVRIEVEEGAGFLAGQRVVARFELGRKPLGVQWARWGRQMIQSRFGS